MKTAIIGVGSIGRAVAADLVRGGEDVVLAAHTEAKAEQLAQQLGSLASAASVSDAVAQSDTVLFAVWLDAMKDLITQLGPRLAGKTVIDPSNPVTAKPGGGYDRTLPDDVTAASVINALLPPESRLVKAFGTLGADSLAEASRRSPTHAVLFYATDDPTAQRVIEQLINAAGFDPMGIGGLDQAGRIEMFGDLHQFGGLGRLVDQEEAQAAIAAKVR